MAVMSLMEVAQCGVEFAGCWLAGFVFDPGGLALIVNK